jgi:hypothetical protein
LFSGESSKLSIELQKFDDEATLTNPESPVPPSKDTFPQTPVRRVSMRAEHAAKNKLFSAAGEREKLDNFEENDEKNEGGEGEKVENFSESVDFSDIDESTPVITTESNDSQNDSTNATNTSNITPKVKDLIGSANSNITPKSTPTRVGSLYGFGSNYKKGAYLFTVVH